MRIAYGKMGRSIPLTFEEASSVGGDIEVLRLMHMLAKDHEVHIVGKNRANIELPGIKNHWLEGEAFGNIPSTSYEEQRADDPAYIRWVAALTEATNKLPKFDAWVIWLGQHGTSCSFIPTVARSRSDSDTVKPLMMSVNYAYPLVHMLNQTESKAIYLCPDPRNLLKLRDLWDFRQRTALAQYRTYRDTSFYDSRTGKLTKRAVDYVYSGIEMLAVIPPAAPPWDDRIPPSRPFGILVNEGPSNVKRARVLLVQNWLKNLGDYEMFGHWSDKSQATLGRVITPVHVTEVANTLRRWRSTITFPASNTGWATSKPWECFAYGTVCFRHPDYDDQRHIFGSHMPVELRNFLCVISPTQLEARVKQLEDDTFYWDIIKMQWEYYQASRERLKDGYAKLEEAIHAGE